MTAGLTRCYEHGSNFAHCCWDCYRAMQNRLANATPDRARFDAALDELLFLQGMYEVTDDPAALTIEFDKARAALLKLVFPEGP